MEVKLFADDCLLYRTIESESDTKQLQEDLSKMTEWSKKWLMRFNAKKCYVMRLKRSRQNIVSINKYNIDGSTLEEVEHHPYLGVELGNDFNWNHHIDQITTKATILAFLILYFNLNMVNTLNYNLHFRKSYVEQLLITLNF